MPFQAVIFDKSLWSPETSLEWLNSHNFHPTKPVQETSKTYRYKLSEPGNFEYFKTVSLKGGIRLLKAK